jgi:hypothetical protein
LPFVRQQFSLCLGSVVDVVEWWKGVSILALPSQLKNVSYSSNKVWAAEKLVHCGSPCLRMMAR